MEFLQRDFSKERALGQARVEHFLGLTGGMAVMQISTGEDFFIVVSGGCTLAIPKKCILEINEFGYPKSLDMIMFITINARDFMVTEREYTTIDRNFSVIDYPIFFRQGWHVNGDTGNPITEGGQIIVGKIITRQSDLCIRIVLKAHMGKVILFGYNP